MNKEFEKKRKIISVVLILVALVIIIFMAVIILGKSKNTKNSAETSNEINVYTNKEATNEVTNETVKKTTVDNVILEKTKIVYENGTSKITTKVTNNGAAIGNLKFVIKFIANDGSVIAKSFGNVGAIKQNETKYIDSSVSADVSNAKKAVYGIKK